MHVSTALVHPHLRSLFLFAQDDYARLGGQYIHFFIAKGDGSFHWPVYRFPGGWDFGHNENVWASLPPADFDGDGKTDIIRSYYT